MDGVPQGTEGYSCWQTQSWISRMPAGGKNTRSRLRILTLDSSLLPPQCHVNQSSSCLHHFSEITGTSTACPWFGDVVPAAPYGCLSDLYFVGSAWGLVFQTRFTHDQASTNLWKAMRGILILFLARVYTEGWQNAFDLGVDFQSAGRSEEEKTQIIIMQNLMDFWSLLVSSVSRTV